MHGAAHRRVRRLRGVLKSARRAPASRIGVWPRGAFSAGFRTKRHVRTGA